MTWTTPTFEVTSGSPIELGARRRDDGDGLRRCGSRYGHKPVRVRLPHHAIGYSPAARSIGWRESLRDLWHVVLGRPSRFKG